MEAKMEEYKNWEDLNVDERVKVLEGFKNTEDRNESDRDNPREEDVKDYYEDNAEKFDFVGTGIDNDRGYRMSKKEEGTIKVYNEQIAKEWRKLFGSDELPIKSITSHIVETPSGFFDAFMLDIDKITQEQLNALINYLSEQTHRDEEECRKDAFIKGVPILVDENSQYDVFSKRGEQ